MRRFIEQVYRNNRNYKGIIFLDRDGTVNQEVDYLRSKYQIKILPTVIAGIRLLNKNKIAVVVITNQPVVARGIISIEELKKINDTLFEVLKKKGAFLDAIYSCPHHPEKHHPDIPKHAMKFRIVCLCRKPGTKMYEEAHKLYGSKEILGVIGDQTRDVVAGRALSAPTVIVKTGYGGGDRIYNVKPDFVSRNFLDAVQKLF